MGLRSSGEFFFFFFFSWFGRVGADGMVVVFLS